MWGTKERADEKTMEGEKEVGKSHFFFRKTFFKYCFGFLNSWDAKITKP